MTSGEVVQSHHLIREIEGGLLLMRLGTLLVSVACGSP